MKHKFEIVTIDDETEILRLNGKEMAEVNHDEHGWAGMASARQLFQKIAKEMGSTVEYVDE